MISVRGSFLKLARVLSADPWGLSNPEPKSWRSQLPRGHSVLVFHLVGLPCTLGDNCQCHLSPVRCQNSFYPIGLSGKSQKLPDVP